MAQPTSLRPTRVTLPKTARRGDIVEVKTIISHPMEIGLRLDESGKRVDANIAQPVPVYWTYITAWSTPDGIVQFRDDIYKRDGVNVPSTIGAPTPVASAEPMPQTFEPGDEE